jgi:hypothetical protein
MEAMKYILTVVPKLSQFSWSKSCLSEFLTSHSKAILYMLVCSSRYHQSTLIMRRRSVDPKWRDLDGRVCGPPSLHSEEFEEEMDRGDYDPVDQHDDHDNGTGYVCSRGNDDDETSPILSNSFADTKHELIERLKEEIETSWISCSKKSISSDEHRCFLDDIDQLGKGHHHGTRFDHLFPSDVGLIPLRFHPSLSKSAVILTADQFGKAMEIIALVIENRNDGKDSRCILGNIDYPFPTRRCALGSQHISLLMSIILLVRWEVINHPHPHSLILTILLSLLSVIDIFIFHSNFYFLGYWS